MKIHIIDNVNNKQSQLFLEQWGVENDDNSDITLSIMSNKLAISDKTQPKIKRFSIDFGKESLLHRSQIKRKKKEILAKIIKTKNNFYPTILDATPGFGKDAFIFASLGCKVTMVERNPIVAMLLADGLKRAEKNLKINYSIIKRMILIFNSSFNILKRKTICSDIIYLDPMFPPKKKPAKSKKEMQLLKKIVGYDTDADQLLNLSRNLAKDRVIVKRPIKACPLANSISDFQINTKNYRFDIYLSYK